MLTLKQVNKAIAAKGGKEELVKGSGYYYFVEGTAWSWTRQSVYVNTLNQMTLEAWVNSWEAMRAEYLKSIGEGE